MCRCIRLIKYKNEIVPALLEGENHAFIQHEIKIHASHDRKLPHFENLSGVMRHYNDDLSKSTLPEFFRVTNDLTIVSGNWRNEVDRDRQVWNKENLVTLFTDMTLRHCARYYVYIGKPLIENTICSAEPEMQLFIDKIVHGSMAWYCHGSGVRGWLTNDEMHVFGNKASTLKITDGHAYMQLQPLFDLAWKENLYRCHFNSDK